MVQVESVVSGHRINLIRERLAEKFEFVKFDPFSKFFNNNFSVYTSIFYHIRIIEILFLNLVLMQIGRVFLIKLLKILIIIENFYSSMSGCVFEIF